MTEQQSKRTDQTSGAQGEPRAQAEAKPEAARSVQHDAVAPGAVIDVSTKG